MVPFGVCNPKAPPLMLMEGSIVHTNEIMVLLGDNWFVERSAKESIDIINRRQSKIESLIVKFNAEKEQHENWIKMINSVYGQDGGFIEINEKCDEEEEKRWKEVHRQKVREHKIKEAAERVKIKASHDDMMKRLEQLEVKESEPLKSSLKQSGKQVSKSVMFQETGEQSSYEEEEEISVRPEKEESSKEEEGEEEVMVFSGEVVERSREGQGRIEGGGGEVKGKVLEPGENQSAPLRDPHHKDQPQPKKVSQFKQARQAR